MVILAATLVAGCAAYYSVFGLSQLFAGASLAVVIMAGSLEFSKVIAVSMLEKYWDRITGALRLYLIIGVTILVCITSAGIYGFLSNAYQKTASNLEVTDAALSVLNNKRALFEKGIADNQKVISNKTNRVSQLSNLRDRQEGRIDAATKSNDKGRARADIDAASKEVQTLNTEIDALNVKNSVLSDSVNVYANKAIDAKAKGNATSEIGPLKYLAQLTGYPMDKIINWFILLLIFVFDPLAVALVIATNKVLDFEREDSEKVKENVKNTEQTFETGRIFDAVPFPDWKNHHIEIDVPEQEVLAEHPEAPYISDDFQIGPDGAYEHTEELEEPIDDAVNELLNEPVNDALNEGVNEGVNIVPVVEEVKPIIEQKQNFVIPTGKIEVENIKEKRLQTNRGFSANIPQPKSNTVQRIGGNKYRNN